MFEDAPLEPYPLHLRFRVQPVRAGEQCVCWVIGPQVVCETHFDKKLEQTKPCRAWITKGKLPCPLGDRCKTRTVSYQPLRMHQGEDRAVVMFSRTTALAARDLLHQGTCLLLYRPKQDNHPALKWKLLIGTDDPAPGITSTVRRQSPWEIKPYLLHMWQDEQICKALGVEFRPSPATMDRTE